MGREVLREVITRRASLRAAPILLGGWDYAPANYAAWLAPNAGSFTGPAGGPNEGGTAEAITSVANADWAAEAQGA